MSIKGFKLSDGTVEKYDFPYLDNIDVQLQHLGSDVRAVLNNKADIDGSYINLNAGTADNLNSSVGIEDQTPYNFRTSGGSTEIGDREELNAVVGVSVPWNQYALYDESTPTNGWTSLRVSLSISGRTMTITSTVDAQNTKACTMRKFETVSGHKYYLSGYVTPPESYSAIVGFYTSGGTAMDRETISAGSGLCDVSRILSATADGGTFRVGPATSAPNGTAMAAKDIMLIDLTLLLGSTVADYIYALEQSNAGAGVAWFRKYFPKLFYQHNSGELLSVRTNLHRMVGFNQWDEEWELGSINTNNGTNVATTDRIRSKNYIRIVPNTAYYICKLNALPANVFYLAWYDGNQNFISVDVVGTYNRIVVTPQNASYMRFWIGSASYPVTTYNNDICINLSWDGERNGEYEPYVAHEYALSDITLRGILKLDASNNLYADGDIYPPSGEVQRRYKEETFDGTESGWTWYASYNQAYISLQSAAKYDAGVISYVCDKLQAVSSNGRPQNIGNFAALVSNGASVAFSAPNCDTLEKFKTWLGTNNVTFVYELATPTTETASPYQQTQIVDDFGTEEFVDAAVEANERDVAVPVGHETFYQNNLKAKLEMAPNSPDGDGVYVVQQTNGENEYVPLVIPVELPTAPTDDGTYVLKITVSGGTVTKAWVEEV